MVNSNIAVVNTTTGELVGPEVTETGLILPPNMPFEEWRQTGEQLKRIEKGIQWALGDWLNYGECNYGGMYTQALDETDYSYSTLTQAKWVASKICNRLQNVSWSHHREVAGLDKDEQDRLLSVAETKALSRKEFHALIQQERRAARIEQITSGNDELSTEHKYHVIYADPPWQYEHVKTESRAIENQYPTMTLDDICELPVDQIAQEDSVLFMWTTSPKLAESFEVLNAWGFTYRTCAVWDKQKIGMGYYFRQRHEILLVATKGSLPTPEPSNRPDSVFTFARGEHSAKPHEVAEMIESMYPEYERIELFCRSPRPGWSVWGNQSSAA